MYWTRFDFSKIPIDSFICLHRKVDFDQEYLDSMRRDYTVGDLYSLNNLDAIGHLYLANVLRDNILLEYRFIIYSTSFCKDGKVDMHDKMYFCDLPFRNIMHCDYHVIAKINDELDENERINIIKILEMIKEDYLEFIEKLNIIEQTLKKWKNVEKITHVTDNLDYVKKLPSYKDLVRENRLLKEQLEKN